MLKLTSTISEIKFLPDALISRLENKGTVKLKTDKQILSVLKNKENFEKKLSLSYLWSDICPWKSQGVQKNGEGMEQKVFEKRMPQIS